MATIRKFRNKWQVQIRRMGHRPVSKSFHVRKDAETWARLIEVQADKGEMPPDPRALQRVTLGELVSRYRDTVSTHKRTSDYERTMLNAFLRRPICSKRLSELRTEDFAEYRDERLKVLKPTSLRRELVPIRNLFTVARDEWGLPIRENPLNKLQLRAFDKRRERRLEPGELDKLIGAAKHCRNQLIATVILFALETGMRRGEILSMKWGHISIERRAMLIPDTKNGEARTIPLTVEAIALLHSCKNDLVTVFPTTANAFRLAWERLRRRAGIDDLHFHDLRHEAISRFFEKGLTTPEVALISGHKDMRMLFRYSHATRESILAKFKR